ncbi:MAG: hypothetical protein N2234_06010 [Planctomycetota bacterium]|nr:hypothetical protein [Planctomycetota bacterium]
MPRLILFLMCFSSALLFLASFLGCASNEMTTEETVYGGLVPLKPEEHRHRAEIALNKLLSIEQDLEKADSETMREYIIWERNRYEKEFKYHLKEAKKHIPNDAQVNMLEGAYLLFQKEYKNALKLFEKVLEKEPKSAGAHFNSALCYDPLGDIEQAYSHCAKALQLDPKFSKAAYLIVELERKKREKESQH